MRLVPIATLVVASLLPVLAAGRGGLDVSGAWARASPPGVPKSAVYFRMSLSDGAADDRLVGVFAPDRGDASLHATVTRGGQTRMKRLDGVTLPAGSTVAFEPGGRHVMITGLEQRLAAGERLNIVLRFAERGDHRLQLPVRPLNATGP